MTIFREDEWEGPLFCGKNCFKHQNKALNAAVNKAKVRIPWHNDGLNPEIDYIAVLIDWLTTGDNYNQWYSDHKQNGATKSVITNEITLIVKSNPFVLD